MTLYVQVCICAHRHLGDLGIHLLSPNGTKLGEPKKPRVQGTTFATCLGALWHQPLTEPAWPWPCLLCFLSRKAPLAAHLSIPETLTCDVYRFNPRVRLLGAASRAFASWKCGGTFAFFLSFFTTKTKESWSGGTLSPCLRFSIVRWDQVTTKWQLLDFLIQKIPVWEKACGWLCVCREHPGCPRFVQVTDPLVESLRAARSTLRA